MHYLWCHFTLVVPPEPIFAMEGSQTHHARLTRCVSSFRHALHTIGAFRHHIIPADFSPSPWFGGALWGPVEKILAWDRGFAYAYCPGSIALRLCVRAIVLWVFKKKITKSPQSGGSCSVPIEGLYSSPQALYRGFPVEVCCVPGNVRESLNTVTNERDR